MKIIKGISISSGFSIGKSFLLKEENIKIKEENTRDSKNEIKKLNNAIKEANSQIIKIKKNVEKKLNEEEAKIFDAHLEILNDPELFEKTKEIIINNNKSASFAFKKASDEIKKIFETIDNEYMRERVLDITDVSNRLIKILEGIEIRDLSLISEETIIIARDLTPSEISQLDSRFVKGFVTEIGGTTSHSAIIARTLGIPAISGIGKNINLIKNNEKVLLNAKDGILILDPQKEEIENFEAKKNKYEEIKKEEDKFINISPTTKDNWKTKIAVNIGNLEDLNNYKKLNIDGVGLFRTEFLYMNSDKWPTEEEQFNVYKKILETVNINNETVVIRTLDIGGDKKLKYFNFPKEENPFLGYRAIRLSLDKKDIFITQIRALLRASKFGNLAINLPMIATIDELKEVKKIIKNTENELIKEGQKINKYQIGMMVEVPSVVELADKFIKYVDFFSIGTNDLIQYTFAVDRLSEKVAYLYQPLNPTILRMIYKIIKTSHENNKWTAICGELARETKLIPIFIAMGLDEFSMSASFILKIRRIFSKISKKESEKILEQILDSETEKEVSNLIDKFFKENNISYY
ncbi:MAG: phosphoenolpyruvate-protein phosphotransferase [Candidatus Hepatoplasma vulgare]|nr:MAG: phosphoenolpyruvate-protein phosphotransferase [Candidatus Hepatoplasma sp.]